MRHEDHKAAGRTREGHYLLLGASAPLQCALRWRRATGEAHAKIIFSSRPNAQLLSRPTDAIFGADANAQKTVPKPTKTDTFSTLCDLSAN
jgi:hypothetical protein